jgi:hypothetical protein
MDASKLVEAGNRPSYLDDPALRERLARRRARPKVRVPQAKQLAEKTFNKLLGCGKTISWAAADAMGVGVYAAGATVNGRFRIDLPATRAIVACLEALTGEQRDASDDELRDWLADFAAEMGLGLEIVPSHRLRDDGPYRRRRHAKFRREVAAHIDRQRDRAPDARRPCAQQRHRRAPGTSSARQRGSRRTGTRSSSSDDPGGEPSDHERSDNPRRLASTRGLR